MIVTLATVAGVVVIERQAEPEPAPAALTPLPANGKLAFISTHGAPGGLLALTFANPDTGVASPAGPPLAATYGLDWSPDGRFLAVQTFTGAISQLVTSRQAAGSPATSSREGAGVWPGRRGEM